MQTDRAESSSLQFRALARQPADDLDLYSRSGPFLQDSNHPRIADLRVPDENLLLRALQKGRKLFARVYGADYKVRVAGRVRLALDICIEQLYSLRNQLLVSGDKAKTATVIDVQR